MENNYFKTPMKFYFVSFYFFILIFIIFFFIKNIMITENIKVKGVLQDVVPKNYVFSEYNGTVMDIYVDEGDIIKEGDQIAKINIIDPEEFSREKNIEYLNNKLEIQKEKGLVDYDLIKELEVLNNIKSERIITSEYSGEVDSLFVNNYDPININQNILKFKNKNSFFYLEAFLTPDQIYGLEKKYLVYFTIGDQEKKYKAYIHKISDNLYITDDLFLKGEKLLKASYKVNIRILEQDRIFIEGMKVDIEIIKNQTDLYSWFKF